MVSNEQLLEDLREFADELGETPTASQMSEIGPWDDSTYNNHFGSWNNALKEAGLKINKQRPNVTSKESLLDDLCEFAEKLGKAPTEREMEDNGPRTAKTYEIYFGSWNNALELAGFERRWIGSKEAFGTGENYYGESWTQKRRETLQRDNYRCRVCYQWGQPHVHHITPRREFDDVDESNTLDNLITLCPSCHMTLEGKWQDVDPDKFAENGKSYIAD